MFSPIGIDREESHIRISQILTEVPCTGRLRQKREFLADRGFDAICNYQAGLFFDVAPDFDKIYRGLRSKNITHAHLGLIFQLCQVSIQLIFRNSFAAVELIDTGSNLCVNRSAVFQKPAILFFLSLHQTEQDFLDAAGTARPEQLLDSGLKARVMDFDVHDLILQSLVKPVLIVADSQSMSRRPKTRNRGELGFVFEIMAKRHSANGI
jgi:hypothetical protein